MAVSVIEHKQWKLLQADVPAGTSVALPSNISEVYLRVTPSSTVKNWYRSTIIPYHILTDNNIIYDFGDNKTSVEIMAKKSQVVLAEVIDSSSIITSSSLMDVFVK